MENPQAQMPQGQPGQAPEQMQQGAPQGQPQQGGQDPQMQQIMQLVQQMMQQGAQPVEAAAELLSKQVPPEIVMQVFVQLGMPEQDAQAAIQQAMQGGQQPQGQGEEQMEGQASNPQEEMAEQGAPAPDQGGQPSPAEEIQMRYGGRMPRRLRSYAEGGDNQEMQAVMQQVQDMMSQGSDAKQVMDKIQAAIQQGQISPEVGATVMEQLSGMQQATDPQGSDVTMTEGSQDPQAMDPNMAVPDTTMGMAKFGGNLKKLMSRAYGGPAIAPGTDSKTYAQDRTSMFVGAVKNSAYKSTLDDEFPSLGGNQMAYGGDLPKAKDGIIMKDGKLTIDPTQFKSEAEYKAAALDWNMDPNNAKNQVTGDLLKTNAWKAPEPTYEAGKNYNYDPATKQWKAAPVSNQFQFAEGDIMGQDAQGSYVTRKDGTMQRIPSMQNQGASTSYSQINPVQYQNPMGNGFWDNVYAGTSPFARMVGGIGVNNGYDPRITGANLPGGMNANQFLGAVGANGLVPGMAGNVAGQNWRIGEAEKFKEGSIWKGNRRKGVRYQIDWGDAAAMNPAAPVASAPTSNNAPGYNPTAAGPGYSGYNADANGDGIPDYLGAGTTTMNATGNTQNQSAASLEQMRIAAANAGVPYTANSLVNSPTSLEEMRAAAAAAGVPMTSNSTMQPSASTTANQTLVNPGSTDVVNPATEVNSQDQSNVAAVSDGSNMMWNFGNSPSLQNPNPQTGPEQFPSLIPGSNEMISKDAVEFQKRQMDQGLKWNEQNQNWESTQEVASNVNKQPVQNTGKYGALIQAQKVASLLNKSTTPSSVVPNLKNDFSSDYSNTRDQLPLVRNNTPEEPYVQDNFDYPYLAPQKNGGSIDPKALSNAINLINRAFGGRIPRADNGINLGSEDTDVNKIPDYLQAENLPANPFNKSGTIEDSAGKKLDINWNQVGAAAGDMYMNAASKVTNFANKINAMNPERDMAKLSALNRPSNTYDTMKQGLYDQAGNFIPNDIGNQILNPTDTNYNNQRQIFAYGGRVYEIGGEVDLDDNELAELAAAGFKLSRV